jgi:hypothetical protein
MQQRATMRSLSTRDSLPGLWRDDAISQASVSQAGAAATAVPTKLTLIVTTSPCKSGDAVHRRLFRALFASFGQVDGLEGCRIIVVCDGYKLINSESGTPMGRVKVKNGSISTDMAHGYADFLSWLDAETTEGSSAGSSNWLSPYRVELLRLPEWRGWSSGVEHALRLVCTPFVMVIQDDRIFVPRYRELGLLLDAVALANSTADVGAVNGSEVTHAHDTDIANEPLPAANQAAAAAAAAAVAATAAAAAAGGREAAQSFDGSVGYVLLPTNKFRRHENEMRSLAGHRGLKLSPDQLLLPLDPLACRKCAEAAGDANSLPVRVRHVNVVQPAVCGNVWSYCGVVEPNQRVTALIHHPAVARARLSSPSSPPMAATTTESEAEEAKPAIRLLRCWRLLDTTHVASVQWYRSLYTSFPELTRKGMFAEDCLSARHMADSLGGEISFRSLCIILTVNDMSCAG